MNRAMGNAWPANGSRRTVEYSSSRSPVLESIADPLNSHVSDGGQLRPRFPLLVLVE